ncbi:MAG: M12 family metallo-peptidase [Acidobacteriota bacterium]
MQRSLFRFVLAAALVLAATAPAFAAEEILSLQLLTRSSSEGAVESWQVDVNPKPLERGADALTFELFDGQRHLVELYELEERGPGDVAWRGTFADGGQVVLTLKHGWVVGVLFAPDGVYELTTSPRGQIFQKLDLSAFSPCAHEDGHAHDPPERLVRQPRADPPVQAAGPQVATRASVNIDVMSLYTPQARSAAGGTSAIQATAQSAIDVSNTAFANSNTVAGFTLVHTQEIAYNDSGNIQADRNYIQSNSTVNNLRDQYNADLVGLLVENGGGFCGIAFLLGNESASAFAPFGYQVTARNCAVGNLSYPHEHGHNLGLQHNPQNGAPTSQAYRNYAYGHYINGNYRTVMSYSNPCPSGCTRQPYFSNPDVVFQGAATGINNSRDNSRVIDEVAAITANYRSGSPPPPPPAGVIDWSSTATESFATQDAAANVTVQDGGATLLLQDNTWRRTTSSTVFTLTADTVVRFDFRSTSQGEIHGIGFDEDNTLSSNRIFKVHGTQNYGITDFDNYSGSSYTTYEIPVGQYFTGSGFRLVLVNDNDAGSGNNSYFRNVEVFEDTGGGGPGGGCTVDDDFESGATGWTAGGTCTTGTFIIGSPTQQTSTVVTQVGGAASGSNALYTATNTSAGNADVDGGECILTSPNYSVSASSTLSVNYFHGQRDTGDDASGDYFVIEFSENGGSTWQNLVSIGDTRTTASWTPASIGSVSGNVILRVRVSDGAGPGDIIEGGIDDLSICE